jgi:hypothetical protein
MPGWKGRLDYIGSNIFESLLDLLAGWRIMHTKVNAAPFSVQTAT